MEENKNLNLGEDAKKTKKKQKQQKQKKEKLIKNEFFLKKGGYSIAITAIVLAGIIILNILLSALSERFVLEFDMTIEKENSISEENIDYIRDVEQSVSVTVCAAKDEYIEYIATVAQQNYGISTQYDTSVAKYFNQTLKLIEKYGEYNKKIDVEFVDTQSPEFMQIASDYSDENLQYGDIIVSTVKEDESVRHKIVGFEDVYIIQEDYSTYQTVIGGNNIETALTSAIAYVLSDVEKKVAILTGHSSSDYTSSYKQLLEDNNFDVTTISDTIITEISNEYDVIVIPGANTDFLEKEISVISRFLDNDGKLDKGMVVFADAAAPYLTNFYDFLSEWGASIEEGILFETNEDNYMPDDPTCLGSYNSGADTTLSDMELSITSANVVMNPSFEKENYMAAAPIMQTPDTVVAAPKGTTAGWQGASQYAKDSYSTVIEGLKSSYDEEDNEIETRVAVFSSLSFINSEYNETASVANKELTLVMTERAAGSMNMGISFVSKSVTNETFAQDVTEGSATVMMWLFMIILPVAVLVTGTIVYIKRRNS